MLTVQWHLSCGHMSAHWSFMHIWFLSPWQLCLSCTVVVRICLQIFGRSSPLHLGKSPLLAEYVGLVCLISSRFTPLDISKMLTILNSIVAQLRSTINVSDCDWVSEANTKSVWDRSGKNGVFCFFWGFFFFLKSRLNLFCEAQPWSGVLTDHLKRPSVPAVAGTLLCLSQSCFAEAS